MFTVVLVDDEPWALLGMQNSFQWTKYGFEVIAKTTDSLEAMRVIKEQTPDVVFTDIRMDKASGLDIMNYARNNGINSEFIIISGYDEFSYAKDAIKYGIFYYMLKPIDMNEAREVLKKLSDTLKVKKNPPESLPAGLPAYNDFLDESERKDTNENFVKLLDYVNENYCEKLCLIELAEKFFLNVTYICDLFKKVKNMTFTEYVSMLRMDKAQWLLSSTELSVSQVAEKTGYIDYYYFNKIFKKNCGVTPRQYRKERT